MNKMSSMWKGDDVAEMGSPDSGHADFHPVDFHAAAEAPLDVDERPSILFAGPMLLDAGVGATALPAFIDALGLRGLGHVSLSELSARLSFTIRLDHLCVDLRGAAVEERQAVVGALHMLGLLGAPHMLVVTDLATLDWAEAWLGAAAAEMLCEPAPADMIAALFEARHKPRSDGMAMLNDVGREGEAHRIDLLSAEVRRLAATIERLTLGGRDMMSAPGGAAVADNRRGYRQPGRDDDRSRGGGQGAVPESDFAPVGPRADVAPPSQAEVRALIRARRLREHFLPANLFADPAWDMLLDLMAARLAGKRVSVSSLCIASSVPATTALRWIRQLTERGIFTRIDDPSDGRRVFIELSEGAAVALADWGRAVRGNGGLLPAAR